MEKYIAGIFGISLGCLGLYTCFKQLHNLRLLASWKKTGGKIVERGFVESETSNLRTPGPKFKPLVRYNYRVGEQDFTNDAIFPKHMLGYSAGSTDWAKEAANRFPDDVEILYNPEYPADSCLQTPSNTIFYIVGVASLMAILFGGFVLIFGVDNWVGFFDD